jgi:hypothetical protein
MYEDEYYSDKKYDRTLTSRELRKKYANGKHVPNQNESKLLRRLMQESGMDEKGVRSVLKYRRMLAEAARKVGRKGRYEREYCRIVKAICREMKLAKEHPLVKAEVGRRVVHLRNRLH